MNGFWFGYSVFPSNTFSSTMTLGDEFVKKCQDRCGTGDVNSLLLKAGFTPAEIESVFCPETEELFMKELQKITFEKELEKIRAENLQSSLVKPDRAAGLVAICRPPRRQACSGYLGDKIMRRDCYAYIIRRKAFFKDLRRTFKFVQVRNKRWARNEFIVKKMEDCNCEWIYYFDDRCNHYQRLYNLCYWHV